MRWHPDYPVTKLMYRPGDAAVAIGVSLSTLYGLIRSGAIDARKVGSSTLISAASLETYLRSLPRVTSKDGGADAA